MRKSLFISLICLFFSLFIFISPVKALDIYQLDQSQTVADTGYTVVYSGYNRNQTFKVTKGILTKVEVLMKDRQGGFSVTLTVKDETTGSTIATKTQRMDDGDGWEAFNLSGDTMGIVVDKSHTFSMWIGTSYFSSPAPSWGYTGSNVYANGTMRSGMTPSTGDLAFKTYGWELIILPPPAEEEPEDEPPADEPPADEEPGDDGKTPTPSETPSTSDDTVIVPALEYVIVNNSVVDSQKEEGVVVEEEDTVKIIGTAGSGDTVTMTIGENTYTATTDKDGNWYFIIGILDFENSSYTVKAQSKNKNNKVSSEVELFKLNILGEETVPTEEAKKTGSDIFTYMIYGFSGLFVIGLIVLLIFIIKKKKKDVKGNKIEIKTASEMKEEPKDVVVEEEKKDNI